MTEAGHSLVLERHFKADAARVYAAFADAGQLRRWFGPGNMQVEEVVAEMVVGGRLRIAMRDPASGDPHITNGVYTEIVPGRRIAHTWQWEGSDLETLVTIDIEALADQRTRLRLTHSRFPDASTRDKHDLGWSACLENLTALQGMVPSAA